jgi:hypothetical protein
MATVLNTPSINLEVSRAEDACGVTNWRHGQEYLARGAVNNPWRSEQVLHAEVKGSGAKPYQVAVEVTSRSLKPRCSCPAARRNPFCKHVAALLGLWLTSPKDFVQGQDTPDIEDDEQPLKTKKSAAKAPSRHELISTGLDTAESFLKDLTERGLLGLSPQEVENMGQVATTLEGYKLIRLARQIRGLQKSLRMAVTQNKPGANSIVYHRSPNLPAQTQPQASFNQLAFSKALAECWLTIGAIRKVLAARDPNPVRLEDLTGKPITEKYLEPLENRRLVELYYEVLLNDENGFNVYTSYLLDLDDGKLYAERQITPVRLKEVGPKPSYDCLLKVRRAGVYPGAEPKRLKLMEWEPEAKPLSLENWQQAQHLALNSVEALVKLYQNQRANPLNQGPVLALYSPKSIVVEAEGQIWLEDDVELAIRVEQSPLLISWLRHKPVGAFFGELGHLSQSSQLYFKPWSFFSLDQPKGGLVRLSQT